MWEEIVANDPEWNAKLMLVPGLTDAWSGELKETFTKATEEFVVRTRLSCCMATVHAAALTLRGCMAWPDQEILTVWISSSNRCFELRAWQPHGWTSTCCFCDGPWTVELDSQ